MCAGATTLGNAARASIFDLRGRAELTPVGALFGELADLRGHAILFAEHETSNQHLPLMDRACFIHDDDVKDVGRGKKESIMVVAATKVYVVLLLREAGSAPLITGIRSRSQVGLQIQLKKYVSTQIYRRGQPLRQIQMHRARAPLRYHPS